MLVEIKIHKENNGDIENDKMNEIISHINMDNLFLVYKPQLRLFEFRLCGTQK